MRNYRKIFQLDYKNNYQRVVNNIMEDYNHQNKR